jgi:hypothetical protein
MGRYTGTSAGHRLVTWKINRECFYLKMIALKNRVWRDRCLGKRMSRSLLLFVAGCFVNSSVCYAGEFGNSSLLPLGGQLQSEESQDPIPLLKDPYAALLEEQDPYRHAARKAIALVKGERAKQYMGNLVSAKTTIAARMGSSGAGIDGGTSAISVGGMGMNMSGMDATQDGSSKMSNEDSLDGGRKPAERRQRKGLTTDADRDDDVTAPKNPASAAPCVPPACRSEGTSALSKLMPLQGE